MPKCPNCKYKNDNLVGLSTHWRKRYGRTSEELYLVLFTEDGQRPLCACGCGEHLTSKAFGGIKAGYNRDFLYNHHIRINNPWGHNKKAQAKSLATRRKMWTKGELRGWLHGKSKETHPEVAEFGRKVSEGIRSKKGELEKRAQTMAESWATGKIIPLYGSDHPNWRGGTSLISAFCHGNQRLYHEWKYPKLKAANFNCVRCGSDDRLCVHHDKERMAEIMHRMIDTHAPELRTREDNESQEFRLLQSKVVNAVVDHHINAQVSGIVLCHNCHEREHAHLNF